MTRISLTAAAVLVPIVGGEFALGGTKLQTGLARVLVVWIGGYVAAMSWLVRDAGSGLVALAIFWSGAFLVWFGVRSHIESSILLRMLFLLRRRPMTDGRLVDEYTSQHGESIRMAELQRGGLIAKHGDAMRVTPKGKAILRFVSKLR
jgi:hypothetical protein